METSQKSIEDYDQHSGPSWQFREKKCFAKTKYEYQVLELREKEEKNKIQQNTQILRQNFIKDRSFYFQIRNL